jgi:hypothetical protein
VFQNLGNTTNTIAALTTDPCYPDFPSLIENIPSFEGPTNWDDNYGTRIHGYLHPATSGEYTFWIATDDPGRLSLSTDEDPGNARLIAQVPDGFWAASREWEKFPNDQNSLSFYGSTISLTAGGKYYISGLMKETGGGDNIAVAWEGPDSPTRSVIDGYYLSPFMPLWAYAPKPVNGSTIDERKPALEWKAGLYAQPFFAHELYFSSSESDVTNRTAPKIVLTDPCYPYPTPTPLDLGRTYYWAVDEVNAVHPDSPWVGQTWSFTISECLSLDNFEDYNDRRELRRVWRDGYANVTWIGSFPFLTLGQGGSSGSNLNVSTAVGSPFGGATGPIRPTPLNDDAMVLRYDNDGMTYTGLPDDEVWVYDAPYYSEIEANTVGNNSLDVGVAWNSEGVKSLTMWFQGHPVSDGSLVWPNWPAYTIEGRGRDIQGRHDEFYFMSNYPFSGAGWVQTQVLSVENTDPWAKAGVMIREKWTPYSKNAAVFITPGNGVTFQYRENEDGPTISITKPGVTAPQYVKLQRTSSGAFLASHADNVIGPWYDVNVPGNPPVTPTIIMGTVADPDIYIGTAVTSGNADELCTAEFDNLLVSPSILTYTLGDIGLNSAEQLYVALSDGTNTAVVEHNNVNAATLTSWQEWNIELTEFSGQGLDLNNVQKAYIGLGDRNTPVEGGSGAIYVDDLRACPPRCIAAFGKPQADIAQPYDCLVNEADSMVLANDYLLRDELITTSPPGSPISQYLFDGNFFDSVGSNHGTANGNASIITDADRGQVLSLDGVGDYVDLGNPTDPCELDFGTGDWTVCAWVKTTMSGTGDLNKGVIYGKGGDWTGGHRYGLYVNENQGTQGRISLIIDDNANDGIGSSFNKIMVDSSISINDGDWHHVAGLRDVNDLRLYIDGLPDGTNNLPAGYDLIGTHQHNAYIGTITDNRDASLSKFLRGSVDDARIYGYALSPAEVAYLATGGAAGLHIPIVSDADLYQGEAQGNQWINLRDYSVIADQYLDEILWPTP